MGNPQHEVQVVGKPVRDFVGVVKPRIVEQPQSVEFGSKGVE